MSIKQVTEGAVETMGRKRILMCIWLLVLPLAMLYCGWFRWSIGLHFQEVFVRPGTEFAPGSFAVYAEIQQQKFFRLQPTAVDRLWVFPFVDPVYSFLITTTADADRAPADFDGEVAVGAGWPDAERRKIVEERWVTQDDPTYGESVRGLGVQGGLLVRPAATTAGRLSPAPGAMNWAGDWSVLLVPAVQGLMIWLLLSAMLWALLRGGTGSLMASESIGTSAGWRWIPAQMLRLMLLVWLVHQCWVGIQSLRSMRSPLGFLEGVILFALLLGLYLVWLRWVWAANSARGLILRMLAAGLLLLLAKVYWLSTVNYRPSSDYLQFYNYGQQMAAGEWKAIEAAKTSFPFPFLHRSWCYSYPVCAVLGSDISAFESANVGFQVLSVLVFSLLVARVSGLVTAAVCMPLTVVYSEFWYSAGMVAPNVAAYFWIPLSWLLVDVFDRTLSRPSGGRMVGFVKSLMVAVSLGVATGFCIAFIDMLKRYGPFFLLALACFLIFRQRFSASVNIPRLSSRLIFLLVVTFTSWAVSSSVTSFISAKSQVQPLKLEETLSLLACLETDSTALGKSAATWSRGFYRAAPESRRRVLTFRKILHEQLAAGTQVYSHLLLKNASMSSSTNAMTQVLDELTPVRVWRSSRLISNITPQFTLASLISLALVVAGVLRLLLVRVFAVSAGEVFPLLSAVLTLVAAFLLSEGHPYTGQNYAYPLCWTAGILVQGLRETGSSSLVKTARWQQLRASLNPGHLLIPGLCWLGLALVHLGLGWLVDISGLTFHRIVALAPTPEQTTGLSGEDVLPVESRVHAGIRLKPKDGKLNRGDTVERQFVVTATAPLRGVRFFVTGNVRKFMPEGTNDYVGALAAAWKGLPVDYEVLLGGQVVSQGALENLAFNHFVERPAEFWRQATQDASGDPKSVVITLRLRCREDVNVRRLVWPPSLAVEFFH